MLEIQFILQNIHFAISLFAGLVFFAIAWLYFDAWLVRKRLQQIPKFLGFLLVSISFITNAAHIEQSIQATSVLGEGTIIFLTAFFRIVGYSLIIVGLLNDRIEAKPQYASPPTINLSAIGIPFLGIISNIFHLVFPILSLAIAGLYFRRATVGLERHLKPASYGFIVLFVSEIFHLAVLFRSTNNIFVSDLVKSFGPLWIIEHILLVLSVLLLGNWVFKYLLKRIQTQLFIIFISFSLFIFVTVTLVFSGMLFSSLMKDVEKNLKTSVSVLNFAIDGKKAEALSDAQLVSQNPQVVDAVLTKNRPMLQDLTNEIISSKNQSYLLIVGSTGEVLARPDNTERVGESVSEDKLFQIGKSGQPLSSIVVERGIISPQISIRAAAPIMDGENTIGVVITGTTIDNAFVDGIKTATELDSSVYAGLEMAATTFVSPDGKSRYIGTSQDEGNLINTIFTKGHTFLGVLDILSTPHVVAVAPIKDIDGNSIGMLLIGKEKGLTLQTISHSIELTFLVSVLLLCLSVFPIYLISKYITNQFE
ncbi:MAG: cache domain-containing protein [Candidatus Saccharibacteria bacterium]|nr:cache domain-containing protein [Candidatus Saccharibacteria bacterium]